MTAQSVLTEMHEPGEWVGWSIYALGPDWLLSPWPGRLCPDPGDGDYTAEARWIGQFSLSLTGCM